MRPFNLELWKAGEPVITRDGRKIEQLTYFDNISSCYKFYGTLEGDVYAWTFEGKKWDFEYDNDDILDLFHPEPEMWVNAYKEGDSIYFSSVYKSQKDAEDGALNMKFPTKLGTYKLVKP